MNNLLSVWCFFVFLYFESIYVREKRVVFFMSNKKEGIDVRFIRSF